MSTNHGCAPWIRNAIVYPSNHSTFSAAQSGVLAYLFRNMQISFVPLARRPAMAQIRSRCHLKIVASETTRAIRVEVESRAVKREGRGPIVESTVYC